MLYTSLPPSLQHDSTFARMLFTLLYEAVFKQVESTLQEPEADDTKSAIENAMNLIMRESSLHFHPPFIGSLQVCGCGFWVWPVLLPYLLLGYLL